MNVFENDYFNVDNTDNKLKGYELGTRVNNVRDSNGKPVWLYVNPRSKTSVTIINFSCKVIMFFFILNICCVLITSTATFLNKSNIRTSQYRKRWNEAFVSFIDLCVVLQCNQHHDNNHNYWRYNYIDDHNWQYHGQGGLVMATILKFKEVLT